MKLVTGRAGGERSPLYKHNTPDHVEGEKEESRARRRRTKKERAKGLFLLSCPMYF
jgi:hypothetical protein